jgi:hypothetical protein
MFLVILFWEFLSAHVPGLRLLIEPKKNTSEIPVQIASCVFIVDKHV